MAADLRERVARAIARDENGDETGWQAWRNEADAVLAELGPELQPQASAEDLRAIDVIGKGDMASQAWKRIRADYERRGVVK
jgi:hypothetical protein